MIDMNKVQDLARSMASGSWRTPRTACPPHIHVMEMAQGWSALGAPSSRPGVDAERTLLSLPASPSTPTRP